MSGRHHLWGICETGERRGLQEMCGATGFLRWCSWVRQGLEPSGTWSRKVLELYQSSLGEEGGTSSPTALRTADRSVCRCAQECMQVRTGHGGAFHSDGVSGE